MVVTSTTTAPRRRDRQREETRRDLALTALELAGTRGLARVRVPDIAAAAGVATRTFNNYFPSKEAAIVWPALKRAQRTAAHLLARPADEPLVDALAAAVTDLYQEGQDDGLPPHWLATFRSLVASEPGLRGEYLKAADAGERALADAIAARAAASGEELWPSVVAATVVGAERAAVRHWMRGHDDQPLVHTVHGAVRLALAGVRQ
jgi:AcrR family transcriptional regulator